MLEWHRSIEPPVRSNFVEAKIETVYSTSGEKGQCTTLVTYRGEPLLAWPEGHTHDLFWYYPVISEETVAWPQLDDFDGTQADFAAAQRGETPPSLL